MHDTYSKTYSTDTNNCTSNILYMYMNSNKIFNFVWMIEISKWALNGCKFTFSLHVQKKHHNHWYSIYIHKFMLLSWLQVDDSHRKYEEQIRSLENKVSQYEREVSQHQTVLSSTVQANKEQIEKLQQNKAMLEVCVYLSCIYKLCTL